MLIPKEWDLALYPGFQFNPLFEFYEDDARTQPFNLTGYTAQLTIGNGLLVLTSGSGLTITAGTGQIQAYAAGSLTANVPLGVWPWSLKWTDPSGNPDCPVFGQLAAGMPAPSR